MNLASWWRIFKRIRQDISDNNLHSFLVGPHFYRTVGEFEIEHYVTFLAYHSKLILKTANKIVEIKLADMKAHLPVLNLSEIENLIHECKHLVGIFLHQAHVLHALCRQFLGLHHLSNRTFYQRERRAKFMCDVGEELQFHLCHSLFDVDIATHSGILPDASVNKICDDCQNERVDSL